MRHADYLTSYRTTSPGAQYAQLAAMKQTVEAKDEGEPGARYGLGISCRPVAGCANGIWSHGGTMPGSVSEAATTSTGDRAVALSTSTWSFDDDQTTREKATVTLVNHALCDTQ